MAEQHKIILHRVGKDRDIVKIQFLEGLAEDLAHTYLAAAFGKCFKNNFFKIILNMKNIDDPNARFIATIIEATVKARSQKGDIKLINLSESASRRINGFNAYAYLTIDEKRKQ